MRGLGLAYAEAGNYDLAEETLETAYIAATKANYQELLKILRNERLKVAYAKRMAGQ